MQGRRSDVMRGGKEKGGLIDFSFDVILSGILPHEVAWSRTKARRISPKNL